MKGKLIVFWINSGGTVGTGEVAAFEDRGRVVRFEDGGWNPTANCYLTAQQARRARRLPEPQPKIQKAATRAATLMGKAIDPMTTKASGITVEAQLNLAALYLLRNGETLEDWDGICGELANAVSEEGDDILYVEGDIPWKYHMVLLRDGLVHDAWCDGDAIPPRQWLTKMFGARVEVALHNKSGLLVQKGRFLCRFTELKDTGGIQKYVEY